MGQYFMLFSKFRSHPIAGLFQHPSLTFVFPHLEVIFKRQYKGNFCNVSFGIYLKIAENILTATMFFLKKHAKSASHPR